MSSHQTERDNINKKRTIAAAALTNEKQNSKRKGHKNDSNEKSNEWYWEKKAEK